MSGQRILVIEDEHIVALDIKMHLERYGYTVPGMFASGEEALERIAGLSPDLVLMDIKLQGELDGVETAEIVKQRYKIPVILLTAYADDATLQRAKLTQPFAYIIKPFEERELRTAIVIALYRHRMEQMLVQREQLFSTTLQSILDAVIVMDSDHRIEFMNPVAEQMLRTSREACVGEPLASIVRVLDAEEEHEGRHAMCSVQIELEDGSRLPVEKTVAPLVNESGQRSGWVWVFHDISERVRAEKTMREQERLLRQAQKMEAIGRLTGGIAHDFNNLLTVIMGYSKLLVDDLSGPDPVDPDALLADVEGIQKAAVRSVSLTRQLLAFSRHHVMEPRRINANQIVSDMEKMFRRLVTEGVQIHLDLTADPAIVFVDPGQMEQVLLNLVVNARDAMEKGGSILIRTENRGFVDADVAPNPEAEPGEYLCLSVRDTGCGIDPEDLSKIFDPFFTTKEVGRGTGLGLSTVYGIVMNSGGVIAVESTPGRGTTFTVSFPIAGTSEDTVTPEEQHQTEVAGSETVLLVEDDEAIRSLLAKVLRRYGYTVIETGNAGEALLVCEDERQEVDLVVSDVIMPHVPGPRLVERLQSVRPGLKAVLMSGYTQAHMTEEERERLGVGFISKPIDPEEFVRRIRLYLDA